MSGELVASFVTQAPRTLERWQRSLSTAVCGRWSDPAKRPKRPDEPSAADLAAKAKRIAAAEAADKAKVRALLDATPSSGPDPKSVVAGVLSAARATSSRESAS